MTFLSKVCPLKSRRRRERDNRTTPPYLYIQPIKACTFVLPWKYPSVVCTSGTHPITTYFHRVIKGEKSVYFRDILFRLAARLLCGVRYLLISVKGFIIMYIRGKVGHAEAGETCSSVKEELLENKTRSKENARG